MGPTCLLILSAADKGTSRSLKDSMMSKIKSTAFRPLAVVVLKELGSTIWPWRTKANLAHKT